MWKSFVLELHGEWFEFADECQPSRPLTHTEHDSDWALKPLKEKIEASNFKSAITSTNTGLKNHPARRRHLNGFGVEHFLPNEEAWNQRAYCIRNPQQADAESDRIPRGRHADEKRR